MATARSLVLDDAVPLLTLTGPGGVGKTRLALAIGHEVATSFADGVLFVDLARVPDAADVLPAIADALSIPESGDRPVGDALHDALRPRQLLLILDNCEHVLAAAPELDPVLAACPAVQLLATSRAPLHLRGEYEMAVPPLALPPHDDMPVAELQQVEAVALFLLRARAVNHGFAPTAQELHVIGEICCRLDGLPLAIELAAARLKILSPHDLLGRLSARLEIVTGERRGLPYRHRTLRATIAWSYDLLSPQEQALFRRLAVFGVAVHWRRPKPLRPASRPAMTSNALPWIWSCASSTRACCGRCPCQRARSHTGINTHCHVRDDHRVRLGAIAGARRRG